MTSETTPLFHEACSTGTVEFVQNLIEKGEDVNGLDDDKFTPLHYACAYKRLDIIQLLLKHNASTKLKNNRGMDAYTYAIFVNITDFDILKALRNPDDPDYYDNKSPHKKMLETYPIKSISSNDLATLKLLSNGNLLICSHKGMCRIYKIKEDPMSVEFVTSLHFRHGCLEHDIYSVDEAIGDDGKEYLAVRVTENSPIEYYTYKEYGDPVKINATIVNSNKYTTSMRKHDNTKKQNPFCLPRCISWDIRGKWIVTGEDSKLTIWSIGD